MNSFLLTLASIALVLVNMWIGWSLAKYHSRRHPEPTDPPFPAPPIAPALDDSLSIADERNDEVALITDLEHLPSDFSMGDPRDPEALATMAPAEYHS